VAANGRALPTAVVIDVEDRCLLFFFFFFLHITVPFMAHGQKVLPLLPLLLLLLLQSTAG
jgi:hypothetical protein